MFFWFKHNFVLVSPFSHDGRKVKYEWLGESLVGRTHLFVVSFVCLSHFPLQTLVTGHTQCWFPDPKCLWPTVDDLQCRAMCLHLWFDMCSWDLVKCVCLRMNDGINELISSGHFVQRLSAQSHMWRYDVVSMSLWFCSWSNRLFLF